MKVYFEEQVAALCGQHLLNNLLQGNLVTLDSLAAVAADLDRNEQQLGLGLQGQNVDLSGNFSIQVLQRCLEPFGVALSQEPAVLAKAVDDAVDKPWNKAPGFVFNLNEHWFCVRKLADGKLYKLDSMEPRPSVVGAIYMRELVGSLVAQGYSVYATETALPAPQPCSPGDLHWIDVDVPKGIVAFSGQGRSMRDANHNDDGGGGGDDDELKRAIAASLQDYSAAGAKASRLVALTDEPAPGAPAVTVQLRLPSGGKVRRRFAPTCDASEITAWADREVGGARFDVVQPGVGALDLSTVGPVQAFAPNVSLVVALL